MSVDCRMCSQVKFAVRVSAKLLRLISRALLVLATIVVFTGTGQAARRGGVQAVVFPNWNDASVGKLAEAVNESQPLQFELSQAPFFGGAGRWRNTTTFLSKVNTQTAVFGTFYLSFHTDQSGYDLSRRAADLNEYLTKAQPALGGFAPVNRFTGILLSPQLEDLFSDKDWSQKMTLILDKLDQAKVLDSGKIKLRRSVSFGTSLSQLSYSRGGKQYSFRIEIERHGAALPTSSDAWSNDGDFIYKELTVSGVREESTSFQDSTMPVASLSLNSFGTRAKSYSGVVNLWRPAYNILPRKTVSGKVVWTGDSSTPKAWERIDIGTTFDEREKQVLKAFLQAIK